MFHLYTTEGIRTDIPLERIKEHYRVKNVKKDNRARKFINKEKDESPYIIQDKNNKVLQDTQKGAELYARQSESSNYENTGFIHAYQIMSTPVTTIESSMSIKDAWIKISESNFKYMPVINNGMISGIVSDRQVLESLAFTPQTESIHEIMEKDIITGTPATDIRRIAYVMLTHHIPVMPIVQNDIIKGICTRSDILHALIEMAPVNIRA